MLSVSVGSSVPWSKDRKGAKNSCRRRLAAGFMSGPCSRWESSCHQSAHTQAVQIHPGPSRSIQVQLVQSGLGLNSSAKRRDAMLLTGSETREAPAWLVDWELSTFPV